MKVRIVIDRVVCEGLAFSEAQAAQFRAALAGALDSSLKSRLADRARLPAGSSSAWERITMRAPDGHPSVIGQHLGDAVVAGLWNTRPAAGNPRADARPMSGAAPTKRRL